MSVSSKNKVSIGCQASGVHPRVTVKSEIAGSIGIAYAR